MHRAIILSAKLQTKLTARVTLGMLKPSTNALKEREVARSNFSPGGRDFGVTSQIE